MVAGPVTSGSPELHRAGQDARGRLLVDLARGGREQALLAPDNPYDAGPDQLARVLTDLMSDIAIPNGLAAVGYDPSDVSDLVTGALQQQRLLATAPREVDEEAAAGILSRSMELW